MAADAWLKWNTFPEWMGDNTIDMDTDAFVCNLHTSSLTPNAETQDVLADIVANEVSGNGYSRFTMTETWTRSTVTTTFDSDDPAYTASGGAIVARYGVIFDDTPAATPTDPLICWSLLDNAPADVTVTAGNTLTIQINASGIFTVTGMV
jgi:hypothetical protein